jgi:hypothetical protein
MSSRAIERSVTLQRVEELLHEAGLAAVQDGFTAATWLHSPWETKIRGMDIKQLGDLPGLRHLGAGRIGVWKRSLKDGDYAYRVLRAQHIGRGDEYNVIEVRCDSHRAELAEMNDDGDEEEED